ncbi:MAG: excinuclease ABC subunit C [Bacteroidetes bacterium]|nr:MAG: excinuclease ABC subunit C [Bacteroidota bacterium]
MSFEPKNIISKLPNKPGIYQFLSEDTKVIYIGKAKDIKKRVASYFNKDTSHNGKTRVLIRNIANVKFTVVDYELEALLLENTLIKKYQPRYNIQLKDDKSYPFVCVKNERFPRVFSTRQLVKDGSKYYGPYASVKMLNALLELISKIYPLRNCNFLLSEENINKGKFKVCLEYQIGNCNGPCENHQSETDYDDGIKHIRQILNGNISSVIKYFKVKMVQAAKDYQFEYAQSIKDKLKLLEKYKSRSVVVNPKIHNVDVFSIVEKENFAFVNFFKVANGSIVQSHNVELKKKLNESKEELLALAITDIRAKFGSESKEILVSFKLNINYEDVKFLVPQRGDKKKLLELSVKNARYFMMDKFSRSEKLNREQKNTRLLEQMKADLRLKVLPNHIECFDNSNIQGTNPVSAMVVFKKGKPSKRDYRLFNIKSVTGPDDFASMEEVVYRRYKRLVDEKQEFPQLIVIDGGKGQLSSAIKSLKKLNLEKTIQVISIAKKLEELYFPGDDLPLMLDKRSETLKVIQQLRDEAHRFGIKHHRKRRIKSSLKSELEEIKGIGDSTIKALLNKFGSVKKVKEAKDKEIVAVVGMAKAKLIVGYLDPKRSLP